MFYDTSSTYREAYGKFFRSGTLLPDGSSSVPFFRLRSFCSFYFLFLVCFLFARARLNNNPAKVFPAVKYPLFRCSVYLFLGSDCVFPVLPLHPLRTSRAGFDGSSSTTISSQRWRHKRSPSSDPLLAEVFMIIFGNMDDLHNDFFRPPNTEWPKARAIGWQLVLDFLFMLRKRRASRGGGTEKNKTETASIGCRFCRCRPLWRREARPESPYFTIVTLYRKLRYC